MLNEPYAWINVNDEYKILFDDELPNYYPEAWMPLYAHPARELTNEEILNTFNPKCDVEIMDRELLEFARAILKKAYEE